MYNILLTYVYIDIHYGFLLPLDIYRHVREMSAATIFTVPRGACMRSSCWWRHVSPAQAVGNTRSVTQCDSRSLGKLGQFPPNNHQSWTCMVETPNNCHDWWLCWSTKCRKWCSASAEVGISSASVWRKHRVSGAILAVAGESGFPCRWTSHVLWLQSSSLL